MQHYLTTAKRLVIKVGSALLVEAESGALHRQWLHTFIQDVVECVQRGQEVVLVSSGAIPLGRRLLKLKTGILSLNEKQAAASVGQIQLAHAYQEALHPYGITVSQILLTLEDSESRHRYINAKNTLETLLQLKVIPVINENDTVATAEIRYGDNDRLAARVAQMVGADTLVLLSDIDGLYTADPKINTAAQFIPAVTEISPEILAMAGGVTSKVGTGGMLTKLAAAKIALASGCRMVIATGKYMHPLKRIDEHKKNTWFIPALSPVRARKNWLAHHLKIMGTLWIDSGAYQALLQGKSLLSVGILAVEGEFAEGEAVRLMNPEQQEVARGLSNYAADEIKKIMGHHSQDFEARLGYHGRDEVIHRDHMVLTATSNPIKGKGC